MNWKKILKSDPTRVLLEIILPNLEVTIPHSIESMTFMQKRLGLPVDEKSVRESFARVWRNGKIAVKTDIDWMNRFIGDGYSLDDVNWYTVGEKVMAIVDRTLGNL
tara:strand:- start:561 stop:878 length:318 start_codon:yes stop_codon:yes gene_type:complete